MSSTTEYTIHWESKQAHLPTKSEQSHIYSNIIKTHALISYYILIFNLLKILHINLNF